jgi:hypothetical protein
MHRARFGDLIPVNGVDMYNLPSVWLSMWNAFTSLGIMFGSAINGPLTGRLEERCSSLPVALSAVLLRTSSPGLL